VYGNLKAYFVLGDRGVRGELIWRRTDTMKVDGEGKFKTLWTFCAESKTHHWEEGFKNFGW